jgi:hypothetical protein
MKKKYLSAKKISVKVLSAVLAASMSIGNVGAMQSAVKGSSDVVSDSSSKGEEVIPDSQNSSPTSSSFGSQSSFPTTPPSKPINHSELLARLRASYSEDDSEWFADLDAEEKVRQQIQELINGALADPDKAYIICAWYDTLVCGIDPTEVREKLKIAKDKNPELFYYVKRLRNDYSDIFLHIVDDYREFILDILNIEEIANKTETYDDI